MGLNRNDNKPLYSIWNGIKQRCHNPTNISYKAYGGRGIYVCEEWRNNYKQFEQDMLPRVKDYSLDRINPNGPYSKENCRWASRKEQARNTRATLYVTIDGVKRRAADIAEAADIETRTLIKRINGGMPLVDIMAGKRLPVFDISTQTAKGNQGNIARRNKVTHCSHGHEYTEENTYRSKKGWRDCRMCRLLKAQRRRDLIKAGKPVPKIKPNHCINGHEYTPENTYLSSAKGSRLCKICRAASKRKSAARKIAAEIH